MLSHPKRQSGFESTTQCFWSPHAKKETPSWKCQGSWKCCAESAAGLILHRARCTQFYGLKYSKLVIWRLMKSCFMFFWYNIIRNWVNDKWISQASRTGFVQKWYHVCLNEWKMCLGSHIAQSRHWRHQVAESNPNCLLVKIPVSTSR